jgi:hypothetical protein
MPEPSSLSFFAHFTALNDPRIERTKRHPLLGIVFIAVCAGSIPITWSCRDARTTFGALGLRLRWFYGDLRVQFFQHVG